MIDRIDLNDSEVNPVNPVKKTDSVAMNEAETRAEKIDPAGQASDDAIGRHPNGFAGVTKGIFDDGSPLLLAEDDRAEMRKAEIGTKPRLL